MGRNQCVIEEKLLNDDLVAADTPADVLEGRVFSRIGDVAKYLGVSPSIVRYWESEFKVVSPARSRSGQRIYRRKDLENLMLIKELICEKRFTVAGAKMHLRRIRRMSPDSGVSLNEDSLRRIVGGLEEIKRILLPKS